MRFITRHLLAGVTAIVTAGAIAAPLPAVANTSHVVHPGDSIQAAVDAAAPGDTVVVKRGVYHESVVIQKDGITLRGDGRVSIKPPQDGAGLCNVPGEVIGVCVVPADVNFDDGSYITRVKDVTITRLHIVGFEGDGIFGYGTENLRVGRVDAVDNTGYGIARFDGIGGWIKHSSASGSGEAGIYVGDSPEAHALVSENRAWNNGIGVFVRHVHFAAVQENWVQGNCIGIFLLDDGQPEGSGDSRVARNVVRNNNKFCPGDEEEGIPETSGGGIVLLGSVNNVVRRNHVSGNHGDTLVSGGIVLLTTPDDVGSTGNVVARNHIKHNSPADLVQDAGSTGNTFRQNRCHTSMPDGLC
jgi:hypothetical protein